MPDFSATKPQTCKKALTKTAKQRLQELKPFTLTTEKRGREKQVRFRTQLEQE